MRKWVLAAVAVVLGGGAVAVPLSCSPSQPKARAFQIQSRDQLVGGRRALGEVGDYKLTNGIIQVVIQEIGHSRGFGAFGGSLIDIDLVRGSSASPATGVRGNDQFTEMFPAFFLEAMEPSKVSVERDGSDGGPAVILVEGEGNQFLSLAKTFNELVLNNAKLSYQVRYILEPGKAWVRSEVTVRNDGDQEVGFSVDVPTGSITLLGGGQKLFVPGKAGYDMRFRLDEVFAEPVGLNRLPGEISDMVATEGHGTSYAFASDPLNAGYLAGKECPEDPIDPTQCYAHEIGRDSMLIPLAYSSFLGTFWGKLPAVLGPGEHYTYASYLAVGDGDVSSAMKVIWDARDAELGRVSGRILEDGTRQPIGGATVVLQDDQGDYVTSARTREGGTYVAWAPPGRYRAIAVASDRRTVRSAVEEEDYFDLAADQTVNLDLSMGRSATLTVSVVDEKGRPLPAKVSVEATSKDAQPAGTMPWNHLYNLRIGEGRRATDHLPDTEDPDTRRFMEKSFFINAGRGGTTLRPNLEGEQYTVYVSRGIEYEVEKVQVSLAPGEEKQVSVTLDQVVRTPGWVSADFHVHSEHSVDSDMSLPQRVLSYAAEGVDYIASTDHNYVSDFRPVVEGLGLQDWLATTIGIELTTLEMGHFNAWPVQYTPGPVTHGSFNWFRRPPGELFANLRAMAKHGPDKVLVQVNHPRDTIMGYFNAFNVSSYEARPLPPSGALTLDQEARPGEEISPYHRDSFSFDFDVLEVFNGKHQELLRHYRIPEVKPPGDDPTVPIPPPGEILNERVPVEEGVDCDEEPVDSEKCILQPAYPGALDDYYTFLSRGRRLTAVGNSDSHGPDAEAGLPRTYVQVGATADGTMKAFDELAAVDALQKQRVFVTNGPIVDFTVNGEGPGSRVLDPEGKVKVTIRVYAAPWVDVSQVRLVRGWKNMPEVTEAFRKWDVEPVDPEAPCEKDGCLRFEETFETGTAEVAAIPDHSFLNVEVQGERSMWPVFTPYEVPSIAVGEAVGAIGASFGFTDKYGSYEPVRTQVVKPYAFTNPIWVSYKAEDALTSRRMTAKPLGPAPGERAPRYITDLRKLLAGFHGE